MVKIIPAMIIWLIDKFLKSGRLTFSITTSIKGIAKRQLKVNHRYLSISIKNFEKLSFDFKIPEII